MNYIIIAMVCAVLAATPEPKLKKAADKPTPKAKPEQVDPADADYLKLLELDEAVLKEVERISSEFASFEAKGAGQSQAVLAAKIEQKVEPVRKAYEEFLRKYPKHVDGYLAYGSFLNEMGEEVEAIQKWEKARSLDLKNPSSWNNLANVYAHIGPIKKAFQYYEKAIELDPDEPVYIHNLATVTYLFRKDAVETYRIDEAAVFDKSLALYQRAMKLDPTNILLATDYAQSYYGINPLRVEDALAAWNHALALANSDAEKEGIYIHLARVQMYAGKFAEAEKNLGSVKDPEMQELKNRLLRNLERKRAEAATGSPKTNAVPSELTRTK